MKNIVLTENTLLVITGDKIRREFVNSISCRRSILSLDNLYNKPPDIFYDRIGEMLKAYKFTVVDVDYISNFMRQKFQQLCNWYYYSLGVILFSGNVKGKWEKRIRSLKKNGIKKMWVFNKGDVNEVNLEVRPIKAYCSVSSPYDIIGDVHGCLDELEELLKKLGYKKTDSIYIHPNGRTPVYIGDIGDRGPKSVETIELVHNMVESGKALFIPGNHCYKLARYFIGKNITRKYGVEITLEELDSIDNDRRKKFESHFVNLVEESPYYLILDNGNLVVSHAGIRERMIGRQHRKIRDFCLYGATTGKFDELGFPERKNWAEKYNGKPLIVYGHTPVEKAEIYNNTINIDQGCVFGGELTALRYPEMEIVSVRAKKSYYCRLRMRKV